MTVRRADCKDVCLNGREARDEEFRYLKKNQPDLVLRDIQMPVMDGFEALVSERQYKQGMTLEQAFAILKEERGRSFEPKLLDVFLAAEEELRQLPGEYEAVS
ncbi:MAG: hypothetical protein HFH36_03385 [Lachnospiraceae bacterium]|nr:hypothetical protein [Lachnospiraceae bacterium]